MISGRVFGEWNGELRVDDPRSDPASEDAAENGVLTFEGRVGNKNGIVEDNRFEAVSLGCSWRLYRGNVGEIGEACGVFRRTYEDIGVSA